MSTTFEEIAKGEITEATFISSTFEESSARDLVDALAKNMKLVKLNFTLSDMNDADFQITAEYLRHRKVKLYELNIDLTYVTSNSLKSLKELITSGNVNNIFMYQLNGIHDVKEIITELTQLAKESKVNVSFDHPRKRAALGFYDTTKPIDEDKDIAFSSEEKEQKVNKI